MIELNKFNINLESLISKIDTTKLQLDSLKANGSENTKDVLLLEAKLQLLIDELENSKRDLSIFKDGFLQKIKELYDLCVEKQIFDDEMKIFENRMNKSLWMSGLSFAISFIIHFYFIKIYWLGWFVLFSFIIFFFLLIFTIGRSGYIYNKNNIEDLENQIDIKRSDLNISVLRKYFPNNKFLKETKISLDRNTLEFLKRFLESENIQLENKNRESR